MNINITSTSCHKESLATSATTAQDKEGFLSERVRLVEPEIKLPEAEGSESLSHGLNAGRSVVEIPSVKSPGASFRPENEPDKLYGEYPILPFTQEHLDDVTERIKILEEQDTTKNKFAKQKLAALKVQEFIIRRSIGQCDDRVLSEIELRINLLSNELDPQQLNDPYLGLNRSHMTDPLALWPIDDSQCHFMLQSLPRHKNKICDEHRKKSMKQKKKAEKETVILVQKLVETISLEIEQRKEAEHKPHTEPVTPVKPTIFVFNREHIEMAENLKQGLCTEAEKYGIVLTSNDDQRPSSFEKKLFACHQLYREYNKGGVFGRTVNLKYIEYLDYYKDQLKKELTTGQLTIFEAQQLAFLWILCLSRFSHISSIYLRQIVRYSCMPSLHKTAQEVNSATIDQCGKTCLKLTQWAIDNGFLHVADFAVSNQLLLHACSQTSADDSSNPFLKIAATLAEHEIHIAKGDNQLQHAYCDFVFIKEMMTDNERSFNHALEIASKHTLLPLLVRTWHDLGMEEQCYRWTTSGLLKPEHAIECLVELKQQSGKLLKINAYVGTIADEIDTCYGETTEIQREWASRFALYYYLTGQPEKGKAILDHGNIQCHTFFLFLSFVAEEKFEWAIQLMESALEKDKNSITDKKNFMALQKIRPRIMPLLGLLHKKLAENQDCEDKKRVRHLEQALSCLTEQAKTRQELYLHIAEIQEKLGDLHSACKAYDELERFLRKNPQASYENCQLYCVMQAKERLADLLRDLPERSSLKQEGYPEDTTHEEPEKSSKSATRKKRTKQSSGMPTIRAVEKSAAGVKETVLPSASLDMEQISKARIQDTVQAEALAEHMEPLTIKEEGMQEDPDWRLVVRKKPVYGARISDDLTEESVERQMRISRHERYELYNELLFAANIDYNGLLTKHDRLYQKIGNPALKLIIIQNKMWTLRHKTFNAYALGYESHQTGTPVMQIKIDARREILDTLFFNIENIRTLWTAEALPADWRSNPEILLDSRDFQQFRENDTIASRFWIQLGSQVATMGHVMQDISFDQPQDEHMMQYATRVFGRNLNEFEALAALFYQCRDHIDPEHGSRTRQLFITNDDEG